MCRDGLRSNVRPAASSLLRCYFSPSSAKALPTEGAAYDQCVPGTPPLPAEGTLPADERQNHRGPGPLTEDSLDALVRVLDHIRRQRARSRSELVRLTGLGRGVVAERVAQLLDRGLLVERDLAPSTGGRPPRRLGFRDDAGHVLVADLGASGVDVAVTSLGGGIVAHRAEPARIDVGPERVLAQVDRLFGELLSGRDAVPGLLWGIGIGVPGPVEFRTGRPVSPPIMPGWDGYPVRERFAERYGVQVWVDNDVNIMALGELRAGIAVGHSDVVVVKVGTGIGAGIISEGRIHRGSQGSAGDVGHIQVSDDPAVICRCGNRGCLEALAGGAAIARSGEAAARDGASPRLAAALDATGSVSAVDVAREAAHGDPASIEILQAAGRRVGGMLASVVNFFNPSLIVISGGVSGSGDHFLAAIRETVYRRSLPLATRDLEIRRSSLGELAGVIGASAMVVDQLFSREVLPRWVAAGSPAHVEGPGPAHT